MAVRYMENRIRAAHVAFGKLFWCAFENKDLKLQTKHTDDYVNNLAVIEWANTNSIEAITTKHRFAWSCHVHRIKSTGLRHQALYNEIKPQITQDSQRPIDTDNDHKSWEQCAENRTASYHTINTGIEHFEGHRRRNEESKR
ncbi:Hypothetical predicted protein [Octopus vulgaris]|uniref:Uncharacterized protein n=1 Tax=Octopus vulgaris TaxID=6645 RepID=A0AA36BL85_OCTVU|nr:Hypothetical predicted protein [Octopus vulgaris]